MTTGIVPKAGAAVAEMITAPVAAAALAAAEINDMFGMTGAQLPINAALPTIKIMRESPQFECADGSFVKTLRGHILYYTDANIYWAAKFGEGETSLPDCYSSNGLVPDGGEHRMAGPCSVCPMNEFGSGHDGTGKACQNTMRLYVILDGDIMPSCLKAPPSSLSNKETLKRWLTAAPNIASKHGMGVAYQVIQVEFSLAKKDFASGFSASVLGIQTVKVLDKADAEDLEKIKALAQMTRQFKESYLGRIAQDIASEKKDPEAGADDIPI